MSDILFSRFILDHENDDLRQLALQAHRYPDIDIPQAIQQIKGRQVIKQKVPTWYAFENLSYPVHLSLEQSSSEKTALYKSNLVRGNSLVDLTGGLGVDFYFLSQKVEDAIYVERNGDLCKIASHNFNVFASKTQIKIENQESETFLQKLDYADTLYIDPARRDDVGRKTVSIADCTPNLEEIDDLLNQKSGRTIIKLSPMLDISLALKSLTNVTEVHILSVKNECKELVFVKDNLNTKSKDISYFCVDFQTDGESIFHFRASDSTLVEYTSLLGTYLYEPNSSLMKAGGYNYLQNQYEMKKLHPNSHLYTSDILYADFPGRSFRIENVCSFSKKDLKEHIRPLKQANITVRNLPMSVQDLRSRLKLKEGGDVYIFGTTLFDSQKVLIKTTKVC